MLKEDRSDEKSQRNAIIYLERKNGASAVDLAKKYGLSNPRIHRICLKEENKQLKRENEALEAEICRLRNGGKKDEQIYVK